MAVKLCRKAGSMSAPVWMPFYVSTYLADTSHLTTIEHGAYMLLIMHYWQRGGLPDDDTRLANITKMTVDEWLKARPVLAALFLPGWRHKRIDAELEHAHITIEKRRKAGKASAAKRSNTCSTHVEHVFLGIGNGTSTNLSTKPTETKRASPRARASNGKYPDEFETLWRAYRPIASPNSTKADAHKTWEKLSPEERDACLAGLTQYVSWLSAEKQKRDGTKPKHLATFINKRGWEPFLEKATVIPFAANENPDIPPDRLAEILAGIERDYGGRRIR
jgi:uncharacterized protein YdaU (DUF1376 family)